MRCSKIHKGEKNALHICTLTQSLCPTPDTLLLGSSRHTFSVSASGPGPIAGTAVQCSAVQCGVRPGMAWHGVV